MTTLAGTAKAGVTEGKPLLKERLRQAGRELLDPVARALAGLGVHPNLLTAVGCLLSLAAAFAFFVGAFRLGSLLVALGGLCDALDGPLARATGKASRFGAFLDSTLDRFGEAVVLAGIAGFYMAHLVELAHQPALVLHEFQRDLEPETWARVSLIAMLALIGSFLVSYTRARAEGLGVDCRVGWFERPERIVLIILAGAFGVSRLMPAALILLAVFSFGTAIQRVFHVWKNTRASESGPSAPQRRGPAGSDPSRDPASGSRAGNDSS